LEIASGQAEAGLLRLEAGLARLASQGFARLTAPLVCAYGEVLIEKGRIDEAQTALDQARRHCHARGDHNFVAELLRVRGRVEQARAEKRATHQRRADVTALALAHRYFSDAMKLAREQGAPLFALRAALDLAASLLRAGEAAQAAAILAPFASLVERIGAGTRVPEARRFDALLHSAGNANVCPIGQDSSVE